MSYQMMPPRIAVSISRIHLKEFDTPDHKTISGNATIFPSTEINAFVNNVDDNIGSYQYISMQEHEKILKDIKCLIK